MSLPSKLNKPIIDEHCGLHRGGPMAIVVAGVGGSALPLRHLLDILGFETDVDVLFSQIYLLTKVRMIPIVLDKFTLKIMRHTVPPILSPVGDGTYTFIHTVHSNKSKTMQYTHLSQLLSGATKYLCGSHCQQKFPQSHTIFTLLFFSSKL